MERRVVITGLGVVAPNGVGVKAFKNALIDGVSGISFQEELKEYAFGCQVAGVPKIHEEQITESRRKFGLVKLASKGILYGCLAGVEAWKDAKLTIPSKEDPPHWNCGCLYGTGVNGVEAIDFAIKNIDNQQVRRLGGRTAQQAMNSGISAYLGGILGLGNQVSTNSSACNTGTEAIISAYYRIKNGLADIMLAGSSESEGKYVWGPFDSMHALTRKFNDSPEKASCPLSKQASGFVPGSGGGALVVESLASAQKRNAKIYAEITGGYVNSGGQRQKGTMTRGNLNGIVRCIKKSMEVSNTKPEDIDLICGHLTGTIGDVSEIQGWVKGTQRKGKNFPYINSLKSMIGHCLSGSGSIEAVAAVLQLQGDFIHPSLNVDEIHPEIEAQISASRIPNTTIHKAQLNTVAKISLGFGDVNSCVFFKKWNK